jgi:hypothetical protein
MKLASKKATKIIAIPGAVNDVSTPSPCILGINPKINKMTPTIPPNNAIMAGTASTGLSKRVQLNLEGFPCFPDLLKQISWSQLYVSFYNLP